MARPDDRDKAAELAARIARGDPGAEAELVGRYRPGLLVMLRHRGRAEDAPDLCHEVLRVAIENLRAGRLRDDDKLSAYLWGIAEHVSRRARTRAAREQPAGNALDTRPADGPSPEASASASERRRVVGEAIDSLARRDREILRDFYLNERSKQEICQQRSLTPAQFDLVKFRALRRLGKALADTIGSAARSDEK